MHYKIAIVDDIPADREYIASHVLSWSEETGHTVRLFHYPSAEAFLFENGEGGDFDLLLLDIEMEKMSGVELAEAVRQKNSTVQIVFITGYPDYISAGYDVAALHYLMKPIRPEKFKQVLTRAQVSIARNERSLTFQTADSTLHIPLHTVRYLDVYKNYVTVHAEEDHTARRTLAEMETLLDDRFYRVGRGLIVNLGFIKKVTRQALYLSDGAVLPLPRGAYEGLNRAIIDHS